MIVSDTHQFIFHHVPKTGGTSITAALARYCNLWKGTLPEEKHGWQVEFHQRGMHTPLKEIEDLPDYFSIAFVRNPFEIIVSAWDPEQFKDFDQFIEHRILTGLEICGRRSQYEHLSSDDGTLLVDFVGRFENLAEDFYKVINAIEVPLMMLPKRNMRKEGKDQDYRKYYTASSRKIIEKIFEKDLKHFGYGYENE
jgi:hypothetical protein